jgi:TusA-related sulfurtransferase
VKKVYLDAREMEHPKPLEHAIAALRDLGEGEYFYMLHRKKPLPLLSLAEGQAYQTLSYEESEGRWHILISRDRHLDLSKLIEDAEACEA